MAMNVVGNVWHPDQSSVLAVVYIHLLLVGKHGLGVPGIAIGATQHFYLRLTVEGFMGGVRFAPILELGLGVPMLASVELRRPRNARTVNK